MRDSRNVKGSGEAIDKVLAGLRDAEAPAGMERRILERLEGRVSVVEARSGWRGFVPAWVTMPAGPVATRALVCGAVLAGLVAIVLAIPAIRRLGHAPLQSKSGGVTGAPRETASAVAAREPERSSSGSQVRLATRVKERDADLMHAADSDGSDEDSVAMSEMQAASFPASPMPLTAQERLLLRLAHRVDPVEMAMLDPKFRAMQDAEEKAEFQRFFGQAAKPVAPAASGESTADQAAQPSPTDQGVATQPIPDQVVPAQPAMDQAAPPTQEPTQDQPIQKQAAPEQSSPDQSTTQQPTARPTRTGEKE